MKENLRVALKAAELYYENDLTQDEIARNCAFRDPRSQLAARSRHAGLVKITVVALPAAIRTWSAS